MTREELLNKIANLISEYTNESEEVVYFCKIQFLNYDEFDKLHTYLYSDSIDFVKE